MNKQERKRLIESNYRLNLLYNRYKLLSLNMFKWEGLPETIESRFIENSLFNYGLCLIIDDKEKGFMSTPCSYGANMNVNFEPLQVITSGYNYIKTVDYKSTDKKKSYNKFNTVVIRNNDLSIGNEPYIFDYAQRMLEVEQCIRANINQQKFPWFVNASPKTKATLEAIFKKVDNLEPLILANKDVADIGSLEVLTMNTPYVADKLNNYKYELEREILSFHGLNNTFEKKERLLTNEVDSNNDFIERNVELQYKNRLLACEEMNKKFGWNVTVKKMNGIQKENSEVRGQDNE